MQPSNRTSQEEENRLSVPSTARFAESAIHETNTPDIIETPTLIPKRSL